MGDSMEFTDAEVGMLRAIMLIFFLKAVAINWIGLDADAWYVWPWSFLAFAWMLPWIIELINECKDDD